jgi:hypothetical protein
MLLLAPLLHRICCRCISPTLLLLVLLLRDVTPRVPVLLLLLF